MENLSTKEISPLSSQLVKLTPLQSRICVNQQNSVHIIKIEDICFLQADGNYTTFVLKNGDRILASITMGQYVVLLEKHGFLRIHSGHIINPRYLTSICKANEYHVVLDHNYKLPISRRRKSIIIDYISQFDI